MPIPIIKAITELIRRGADGQMVRSSKTCGAKIPPMRAIELQLAKPVERTAAVIHMGNACVIIAIQQRVGNYLLVGKTSVV